MIGTGRGDFQDTGDALLLDLGAGYVGMFTF